MNKLPELLILSNKKAEHTLRVARLHFPKRTPLWARPGLEPSNIAATNCLPSILKSAGSSKPPELRRIFVEL